MSLDCPRKPDYPQRTRQLHAIRLYVTASLKPFNCRLISDWQQTWRTCKLLLVWGNSAEWAKPKSHPTLDTLSLEHLMAQPHECKHHSKHFAPTEIIIISGCLVIAMIFFTFCDQLQLVVIKQLPRAHARDHFSPPTAITPQTLLKVWK